MKALKDYLEKGYEHREYTFLGQDPGQKQVAQQLAARRRGFKIPRTERCLDSTPPPPPLAQS